MKTRPGLRRLDGVRLHAAFAGGLQAVARLRGHLNDINVFPVADGDTGSNLVATLQAALAETAPARRVDRVCRSLADGALAGARGNSGLIMAQFLWGVAEGTAGRRTLDAPALGEALAAGVPFAAEALSNPVEGTVLTVLREWVAAFRARCRAGADLLAVLGESLAEARRSLARTPERLAVLARAGVVDAGGQGLVTFLEGLTQAVGAEAGSAEVFVPRALPSAVGSHGDEAGSERYCAQALLTGDGLDLQALRSELAAGGSAVVVGGHSGAARLHVHTDEPAAVFVPLRRLGSLTRQRVQDMHRQMRLRRRPRGGIALVTDSTCDLPRELLDRHEIQLVPLRLELAGSEYLDTLTITPDQFYRLLAGAPRPTTSQPPVGEFDELFEELLETHDSVISIHLSRHLSGTWNAARAAAARFGDRVSVVDSRQICASLGLLVLHAAESLAEGASHRETVEAVQAAAERARILVAVPNVEQMVRSGRVSHARGWVARALGLAPVITVDRDGRGAAWGRPRRWRSALEHIARAVEEGLGDGSVRHWAVAHAHAPAAAAEFAARLQQRLQSAPVFFTDISPVIGAHAGVGGLALATL